MGLNSAMRILQVFVLATLFFASTSHAAEPVDLELVLALDASNSVSDQEFQLKQHLAITLGKAFKIEAEIIHCKPVEADPDTGASRYLVRCRFTDEHSSKRFLLMLKGMEDQDISISS